MYCSVMCLPVVLTDVIVIDELMMCSREGEDYITSPWGECGEMMIVMLY